VSIFETPPQPTAATGISVGVIGIVGTFCKGPVGTATTVYSLNDAIRKFGGYVSGLTGFLSVLGAFNQGASEIVIVRCAASGAAYAVLDLMDSEVTPAPSVKVSALTQGTDGNNISVQVTTGTAASSFKLIVSYKKVVVETWDNLTLSNLNTVNSQYISLTEDAGATEIPAPLADTPLASGNDGATTADADYVGAIDANGNRTGLKALETVNVNIVLCAQQYSAAIQTALIQHCQQASVSSGLRIAVLSTNKGQTPTQAAAVQTYNEMRALMAYPWVTPVEYPTITVNPDGYYAGRLAVLNPWVSPSNQVVQGILSTEKSLTDDDLMALTVARISPIAYNNATKDFRIQNGVSTFLYVQGSGSDDWSQTCIRREFDKIETEVWVQTQWAKSQPITSKLWDALRTQIDELLRQHRDVTGEIFDFKPTICDSTNNTPDIVAARRVVTKISIRPDYPADFIDHNIGRYIG
jgi:hypothetical protein